MSKGFKRAATSVLKAVSRDLGNEVAYAINDIRHKVVEEAWFGQFGHRGTPETSDFYRWLGPTPGEGTTDQEKDKAQDKGDALGRTAKAPEVEDIMPMEGRPSNHAERQHIAEAYARHREAGPMGLMEMDDIHNRDWSGFNDWLDRRPGEHEPGARIELEMEMEMDDTLEIGE